LTLQSNRKEYQANQTRLHIDRSILELATSIPNILQSASGEDMKETAPLTAEYNSCSSGSDSQNHSGVSRTVPPSIIPTRNLNNRPLILTTSRLVSPNSPRLANSAGKNFDPVMVFSIASSKTLSFTLCAIACEIANLIFGLGVRNVIISSRIRGDLVRGLYSK